MSPALRHLTGGWTKATGKEAISTREFRAQWKSSDEGRINCLGSDRENFTKESAPERALKTKLVFAKRTVMRRTFPPRCV